MNLWSQEENKTGNVRIIEARPDLCMLESSEVLVPLNVLGLHFLLLFKV